MLIWQNCFLSVHSDNTTKPSKPNEKIFVTSLYVKGLSENLSNILKPFNVKIAPRNINDLSHFFKSAKDPTPKLDTAHVVYNIPCIKLYSKLYIGTTKRPLKTRIQEHKKDVYNPPENGQPLLKTHGARIMNSILIK